MKTLIALLLAAGVNTAQAVPVYDPPTPKGWAFVGWERQRYWTIHGRDEKFVPIFVPEAASPVPEPSAYGMLLAGVGMVAWRVRRIVK